MKTRKLGIFLIKSPCNLELKVLECRKSERVDLMSGREPTLFADKGETGICSWKFCKEVQFLRATRYRLASWRQFQIRKAGGKMSRKEEYEQKAEAMLAPIVESNGFELVDVEYVKEAGTWYLRGYIDKPGGITVNDCETVSRAFSDKLDEDDFIEDSYIMEISSPGLDRPLKKEKDFARSIGKLVEIRTYRPIEKQKEFCGELTAYDNNSVTIDEEGTPRTFDKKDIALVRLAIDF